MSTTTPRAERPGPHDYGIPADEEGMLPWSFVTERLAAAKDYWLATTTPDGRPHTRPVWGVWVDGTLHFGGGPHTRWARNLAADPRISVHLESAQETVILEGTVTRTTDDADPALLAAIDQAYLDKYDTPHGAPYWTLQATVAYGWSEFPTNVTRWTLR